MPPQVNLHTSSHRLKGSRQRHQNKTSFVPNRYQPEKQLANESARQATSLCCRRCQLIIKWKLDYGKYPSIVVIRKTIHCCGVCREKAVNIPFHHVCQKCAEKHAVCAKCRLTAEESDSRAMDALRRGQQQDEDAEYWEQLEAEEEEEEEEVESDNEEEKERKQKEKQKTEDFERDHPELERLKGLDISLIRHALEEHKKQGALSLIRSQGKLRERERRSAMRKLQQGDEKGALEIAYKAMESMNNNEDGDDEEQDNNNDSDNDDDKNTDSSKEVPVKQMTKDSEINLDKMLSKAHQQEHAHNPVPTAQLRLAKAQDHAASDTPSDEETL